MEVGDFAEVRLQHLAVARQAELLAVAGDVFSDELSEVWPVLLVEAGDVGSVGVGEPGFGGEDCLWHQECVSIVERRP